MKTKKPDIKADLERIRKGLDEAGMNPALLSMIERSQRDNLANKDYVAYGMNLAYWWGEIDDYKSGKHS